MMQVGLASVLCDVALLLALGAIGNRACSAFGCGYDGWALLLLNNDEPLPPLR